MLRQMSKGEKKEVGGDRKVREDRRGMWRQHAAETGGDRGGRKRKKRKRETCSRGSGRHQRKENNEEVGDCRGV
jgi:hypothetical protein